MSTLFELNKEKLNMPDEIIQVWSSAGIVSLLPIQQEAVDKGLLDGGNFLVVAPTSSGKTFIGEMAAINYTLLSKKTLYLVPFKSVAEEKYDDFSSKYSDLGFNIRISDRDHREYDEDIKVGNYDIAILTYEKLSGMIISNPGLLNSCDCVIVDEIQMLGDPQRGGKLELLLTKIKESYRVQIIALSAVLDDLNGFDKWLNAEVIKVVDRPVELRQGVLNSDGAFEYKEWNTGFVGSEHINVRDLIGLTRFLVEQGEQIIIIKNSVPQTQKVANQLARELPRLPAATKTIAELREEPESETRDGLLSVLRNSIAFHNSDCELGERRLIEKGFREGHIKIIVSTTTLSMGVNLPCKTVILDDHQKWEVSHDKPQLVNWAVGEVRNIFGRAGRLGENNEFGRGIFIAKNIKERESLKRIYLNAPLESLVSVFQDRDIDLRVLDVVASGFGSNENNIITFIFKTFAAQSWKHESAKEQIQEHIRNGISNLLENELIEQLPDGTIQISEIGKVCASMGCSVETTVLLKKYLEVTRSIDYMELMYIVASTNEVKDIYYRGVRWEDKDFRDKIMGQLEEINNNNKLTGLCLEEYERAREQGRFINNYQYKSIVFSLLSKDILLSNVSIASIKRKYGFSTANIRNMTTNLSWMLDIASKLACILNPQIANGIDKINLAMINGAPLDCNHLNTLRVQITREEKIRLIEAGFKTRDDFIDKEASSFKGIIHPKKADLIIKTINEQRDRDFLYWEREHSRRIDKITGDTDLIRKLYSEQGLEFEHRVYDLLNTKFINCVAERITEQRKGEPDILMMFEDGVKVAVQVTAKEDNNKYVDSKKAGEVIPQSARLNPNGYICIGKPDFQSLAIENASHLANQHDYKLIPLYCIVELYIRVQEGSVAVEQATSFIQQMNGYINMSELDGFFDKI